MSETPNQISRREILKRGAFVGGAVVWATPVVQTLGMGRAFAQTPSDTCVPSWSKRVVDSFQGTTNVGGAVAVPRRNPNNAVGDPSTPAENPGSPNYEVPFFSLGRDGWIVLELAIPYFSGKYGEAVVVETTFTAPDYPEEKARVSVSANAVDWVVAGYAYNNIGTNPTRTEITLDTVTGLPGVVRYVKLEDMTDWSLHGDDADGFDVDAVGISCPTPNPQ